MKKNLPKAPPHKFVQSSSIRKLGYLLRYLIFTPSLRPFWVWGYATVSILYWIALACHDPLDPSPVTLVFPPPAKIANGVGLVGAYLSGLSLYFWGIIAWLIPVPGLWGITHLTPRFSKLSPHRSQILGMGLLIGLMLVSVHKLIPTIPYGDFHLPSTGLWGEILGPLFDQLFGPIGTKIVLTFWLCLSLSLMSLLKDTRFVMLGMQWFQSNLFKLNFRAKRETTIDSPLRERMPACFEPPVFSRDPAWLETSSQEMVPPALEPPNIPPTITPTPTINVPRDKTALPSYAPPPLSVLLKTEPPSPAQSKSHTHEVELLSAVLAKTLQDFGVEGQILGHQSGPVVTVIEFQTEPGTKQAKVMGLADDLALALKVDSILIQPLKNKSALGIQIPHSKREKVCLGDIINNRIFVESESPLTFGLGKTIHGEPTVADLASMPHLLIAGSTGSGKSVGVNGMICSIIMKSPPEKVKMILVDPKMLELSVYEGIPHLLMPVITDPHKSSLALKWAILEMERRYKIMQLCSVRNIDGFNDAWPKMSAERQQQILQTLHEEHQISFENRPLGPLPYLMIIIDELADLMITAPKDVEVSIQRLAQKARASGIHMVLATQRPSVDIITGVIKANLPCRIAYQVVSKHDSRTILDTVGAEKLLGRGDLLFQKPGSSRLERLQGALITDEEVINLVEELKRIGQKPQYHEEAIQWIEEQHACHSDGESPSLGEINSQDSKYQEALLIAQSQGSISASFLQRQLKVGYNRAARMVETMEKQGLVEKADGVKPRRWLS